MPEDLIFLAVLVFLLLLWDLLRRRKRKAALQRLTERVRALEFEISSLKTLSSRLEALEKRVIANQPVGALPAMPSAKSPTASAPEAQVREGSAMPFEVGSKREEARPHAGSVIGSVPGTTGSRYRILTTVQASTVRKDLSEPGQPRATTIPAIGAAPHPYRPGIKEWIKKAINYEEIIGGNLFTKLGVIFLVFGLSLFVATQWHRLGSGMDCDWLFCQRDDACAWNGLRTPRKMAHPCAGGHWRRLGASLFCNLCDAPRCLAAFAGFRSDRSGFDARGCSGHGLAYAEVPVAGGYRPRASACFHDGYHQPRQRVQPSGWSGPGPCTGNHCLAAWMV